MFVYELKHIDRTISFASRLRKSVWFLRIVIIMQNVFFFYKLDYRILMFQL